MGYWEKYTPPRLPIVPRPSPPHEYKKRFGATWLPLPQRDPSLEDLEPPPWGPVPPPRIEPFTEKELERVLDALCGTSEASAAKVEPARAEEPPPEPSSSKPSVKGRAQALLVSLFNEKRKVVGAAEGEQGGRSETKLERQIRQGEYRPPKSQPRPPRQPIQLPDPQMRITPLMRRTLERVISANATCGREGQDDFDWLKPRQTRSVPPRRWQWTVFDTQISPIYLTPVRYAERWVFRTNPRKCGQRRNVFTPLFTQ